jgi:GNAT superfamily N-acetyltransferase
MCRILECEKIESMELLRVGLGDAEVAPLLDGLGREYDARYGENVEMTRATGGEFDPPDGLLIVLVDGTETAAGGGFRRHDPDTCEVKRMWTNPSYRRRGLATRVLEALETAAWDVGYTRVVLETGPRQPEAEELYVCRGYDRIEPYGPYPEALAFSLDRPPR